jgi:hypothetical protein
MSAFRVKAQIIGVGSQQWEHYLPGPIWEEYLKLRKRDDVLKIVIELDDAEIDPNELAALAGKLPDA